MKKKFSAGMCKWKLLYIFLFFNLFFAVSAIAQIQISGKVTNKDQTGVPGVSVLVKNTNAGTATDASGNYNFSTSLKARENCFGIYRCRFKNA